MTFFDYYSAIIASIALVLSIGQIVVNAINKKVKIDVSLENLQQHRISNRNELLILCTFVNKSDAPINITRIILKTKAQTEIDCALCKAWIGEHYYPKFPESDI